MAQSTKQPNRDHQIDTALHHSIEHMKSHADVMKKTNAAHEALAKHRTLQQKQASARTGGNAAPQKGAKRNSRKPVSKKQ